MEKVMRKIISIDEEKCDGCGLCIPSCEEGALQIVDGKARLVKEIYCDGLGNCLGECPQGAIEIIEREADPFDEAAVEEHLERLGKEKEIETEEECSVCCGSSLIREFKPQGRDESAVTKASFEPEPELRHWPVQLHLVNPQARFLQEADLLIAADCVPFAYADFHRKFLAGRSLIIGCPKLDDVNTYHQKLVQIFKLNNLKSITLVHMEVGCCFGISKLVKSALAEAGVSTPLEEIIVGVDGSIK
ncbi:MAG: 4Fe-4S ferredoxin [Firmicutes bacterium]|nr:4Fe-4S ferredoxin [Bacillota bacterium]